MHTIRTRHLALIVETDVTVEVSGFLRQPKPQDHFPHPTFDDPKIVLPTRRR